MDSLKTYDSIHPDKSEINFSASRMEDIFTLRQGQVDSPHRHAYYTILIVDRAEGTHHVDFKAYPLGTKQVFFVSPGQVHQVVETERPKGYVFLFSSEFLIQNQISQDFIDDLKLFYNYGEAPPLQLTESQFETVKFFSEGILEKLGSHDDLKMLSIGAFLKLILIECHRVCEKADRSTQQVEAGNTILKEFRNLVNTHYDSWHQTASYAEKLHVTPDHLNRVVRSFIGKSAKEFIQARITVAAKRMLIFTDLSTKEIGYQLGFHEPAHFSAFFKKCTGISPTQFKQQKV